MITSKLSSTRTLLVESSYDSGTHTGFHLGVCEKGDYCSTTPDKWLSKSQISVLEALLLTTAKAYLEENKI